MEKIYECGRCGVITAVKKQVCAPEQRKDSGDYCGSPGQREEMCDRMKEHVSYVCGTCGRPAQQSEPVCNPLITAK